MKKHTQTLGIIAGNGALPRAVAETCRSQGRSVFVLGLKGHADPVWVKQAGGALVRVGAVGRAIRLLKRAGVRDLVFIGGVRRPSLIEIWPDGRALCLLARVGFQLLGDNHLLEIIVQAAESYGFHVVGADTLVPELVAPIGVYGRVQPNAQDKRDMVRGFDVAKTLGQADVGQAVIVQHGLVLAVEGIEGTAALIRRSATLKRKGGGGVLIKVAKPQQDRRVDLPTIGPDTIQALYDAGFKGVAVEAGSALIAGMDQVISLANNLGIFVMGVKP